MKRLVSTVLMALLAGMPALAEAQGSEKPAKPPTQAWSDWSRVARIEAGTDINVIVAGDVQVKRMFVSANDAGLIVLNLSLRSLPWRVKSVLMSTAAEDPDRYDEASSSFKVDDVLLSPDGVFLKDQRVAATEDVVIRVPRERVMEVSRPKSNAAAARIGGGLLGYVLGPLVGGTIGRVVAGTAGLVYGVLIGLVAGVWIGIWRGGKVNDNPIIYRAPAPPA